LLPEEIFGTEEVPEYILSDSSAEEEDATPEQKTNHQLRRRIRHLEHNLRERHAGTEDQPPTAPPHSTSRTQPAGHHRLLQCRT
jgi:hypothetical protein